jgi:hypothetical protein
MVIVIYILITSNLNTSEAVGTAGRKNNRKPKGVNS